MFHSTCCWFAGFWAGVTGTYPGSGSGTQPLEYFHACWQDAVRASVRSDPRAIFSRMERLYEEDWATKFAWQDARVFQTWPQHPAQELLNGQALRTAGRSPAVDFFNERAPKLCGNCNYFKLRWRTDAKTTDASGQEGTTVFYVMRCSQINDLPPAKATITKETAQAIVGLIVKDGAPLKEHMLRLDILRSEFSEFANVGYLHEQALLCDDGSSAGFLLAVPSAYTADADAVHGLRMRRVPAP